MIVFDIELHIAQPVERVFSFFADLESQPAWEPEFVEITRLAPEPLGVGSKFHFGYKLPYGVQRGTLEVVEFEPNRAITVRSVGGSIEPTYRWTFESTRDGTRFCDSFQGKVHFPLSLISPLLARIIRGTAQRNLVEAKRQIEAVSNSNS